jgi:hypothetical protein
MHVGQKWHVRRSVVLDQVRDACGVDLLTSSMETDLARAIAVLVGMKADGLRPGLATSRGE